MYTTAVAVGLLAICALVAGVVVALALLRTSVGTPIDAFLRFVAGAGVASVGSSAMYLFYADTPSLVTLLLGDVAMVSAPALIWVALSTLRGSPRSALVVVAVVCVLVIVASTLLPLPISLAVKLLAVIAFCLATALATLRPEVQSRPGAALLRIVNLVYAAYCAARVIAGLVTGGDSPIFEAWFSTGPSTFVSLGTVVATGIGCFLISRGDRRRPRAPERFPTADTSRWRVSIPDFTYMPIAYGREHAEILSRALAIACRELDPRAEPLGRGAVIVNADDRSVAESRIQRRFAELIAGERIELVEPLGFERLVL